jgi:hypothetical protein
MPRWRMLAASVRCRVADTFAARCQCHCVDERCVARRGSGVAARGTGEADAASDAQGVVPADRLAGRPGAAGRRGAGGSSASRNQLQPVSRSHRQPRPLVRQLSRDECRRDRSWASIAIASGWTAAVAPSSSSAATTGRRAGTMRRSRLVSSVRLPSARRSAAPATTIRSHRGIRPAAPAGAVWHARRAVVAIGSFRLGSRGVPDRAARHPAGRRARCCVDEWGPTINWGDVRDGFIFWSHGERSGSRARATACRSAT